MFRTKPKIFHSKKKKLIKYYHQSLPIANFVTYDEIPKELLQKIKELIHSRETRSSYLKNNPIMTLIVDKQQDILNDPNATLGSILKWMIQNKHTDILLEIRDQVEGIINEHKKKIEDSLNLSKNYISNSSKENKPEEDDLIETISELESQDSEIENYEEKISVSPQSQAICYDSLPSCSYYSRQNAENSIINKETLKQDQNIYLYQCSNQSENSVCDLDIDADNCSNPDEQIMSYYEIMKNEGSDPFACEKNMETYSYLSETLSTYSSETYYEQNKMDGESNNSLNGYIERNEDSDIDDQCNLQTQFTGNTNNHKQCDQNQMANLTIIIDRQNEYNENIEGIVNSIQEPENQNSDSLNEVSENGITITNKVLLRFINEILPSSCNSAENLKTLIIHSDKNFDIAVRLCKKLNDETGFSAVAVGQLNHVWFMDSFDFPSDAIDWADVVIVIITNEWLEEIESRNGSHISKNLDLKYVYRLLQTDYANSGSVNFHVIPVVMEGTSLRFRNHPQLRMALILWREYNKLCSLITRFGHTTRNIRKTQRNTLHYSVA